MKIADLKSGSILSESSFYVVNQVTANEIVVTDDMGNSGIRISREYAEAILASADSFSKEEKKTKTELADILINSSRVAMTVCFVKADKEKPKRAFAAEKAAMIKKVQDAPTREVEGLLSELIENPISRIIPGEIRVMKGRHYGTIDDLGRIHFIDMEVAKGSGEHDARLRQIDPRTIQYIIVNNVRYTLK